MDGEDLRGVESFAEDVNGSELTAEHPVSISRLRRAQETFIITLQERRRRKNRRGFSRGSVRGVIKQITLVYPGIWAVYLGVRSAAFSTCLPAHSWSGLCVISLFISFYQSEACYNVKDMPVAIYTHTLQPAHTPGSLHHPRCSRLLPLPVREGVWGKNAIFCSNLLLHRGVLIYTVICTDLQGIFTLQKFVINNVLSM